MAGRSRSPSCAGWTRNAEPTGVSDASSFRALLEFPTPPGVRVVHPDDQQVRGVERPRDLLLVHLFDRDAFHDDRPVHAVDGHDLALSPAEPSAHAPARAPFPAPKPAGR